MLNHANYYTNENKYLTNSKISTYLRDKPTFKRWYIDGKLEWESSPSLIMGKAVDTWVLGNKYKFNKLFEIKVLKKNNPDKYEKQQATEKTLIAPEMYKKIEQMVNNLLDTKIIKDIKRRPWTKDTILKMDSDKIPNFDGIAGIPDVFQINSDEATIIDLKTSAKIDEMSQKMKKSVRKDLIKPRLSFYWHASDYGYFRQLAFYSELIKRNYPNVNTFKYYWVVVGNQAPHHVQFYKVDSDVIDMVRDDLFENIIPSICKDEKFKNDPIGWGDYIDIK